MAKPRNIAGRQPGRGRARDPAPRRTQQTMHGRVRDRAVRKRDDLGRMIVPLDTPHDALALVVQPVRVERAVGLAYGGFVHVVQRAHQLVEPLGALAAGTDVPVLAGEHVGFHQLVVRQMRPFDGSDAVFKSHDAVLPWPCGASG